MRIRPRFHATMLVIGAILAGSVLAAGGADANSVAGSQGIDTSLPLTDSAVTVNGRGRFASLRVTVNQTANLTNQAVSITWSGATPTRSGPGRFGAHYLQMFQCWGDDDGTNPDNPGPPPEQCVQGAVAGTFGGVAAGLYPAGFALSRVISRSTWANYDPAVGALDTRTTNVWRPFRAVDGTVVPFQTDPTFQPTVQGGNFWLNPYYGIATTNEIGAAATNADGTGAELMQVLTGVESTGLGCGQRVQPVPGAGPKVPRCWIVIVPRGAPADENAGTPFAQNADQAGVVTSPVAAGPWSNRIAIPLEFNPVDTPCAIGADERRIAGTELSLTAVSSWQPALCEGAKLPPFSYATVPDAAARQQLIAGTAGGAGMAVVSRPIPPASVDPADPVVYAPLNALGLVIGFNVERNPSPNAPPEAQRLAGIRIADINLTPRLVAKLLTQSYTSQVQIYSSPGYSWTDANPLHLGADPDFVRFNPEFDQLQIANTRNFGGLSFPAGSSDAAQLVWEWVFADPEARAWLGGAPDEWGMRVNPIYSTDRAANPSGVSFGDPLPNSFPKADPYCFQAPPRGPGNSIVPPVLCGTDWMPYMRSFDEAALVTRTASDGARIVENAFAAASIEVWTREQPQFVGRRSILSVTDTASAAKFGLQTARLSRAGDNGATRTFIAPNRAGVLGGLTTMIASGEPQVLQQSHTASSSISYPLTTLTYAAVTPLSLDADARSDYAAFVEYAVGAGQVEGPRLGQLPQGYAPLPDLLRAQAATAADAIRTLTPPPPPTTTTTTTTTTAPLSTAPQGTVPSFDPFVPFDIPPSPAPVFGFDDFDQPFFEEVTEVPVAEPGPPAVETETTQPVGDEVVEQRGFSLTTPFLAIGRSRYAVPGLGAVALTSIVGALGIGTRRRDPLGGVLADA